MMPVGVLTDCSCVLIGGLLGTVLGSRFTPALREKLTMVLGFASIAIGINSIVKANQMTPVVIAVIFGTLLGELLHLEEHITHVFGAVTRKLPHDEANFDMERYITVVVLFCASGFGIYGVLVEGMSGSPRRAAIQGCVRSVHRCSVCRHARRGGGSDRVAHAGGHAGAVLCGRSHCTVCHARNVAGFYQLRRRADHCGRYAGQRHQAVPHR